MSAKRTFRRFSAVGLASLFVVSAAAGAENTALEASEIASPGPKLDAFDFGLTLGTPSLFNLCITKWGVGAKPVLLRLSGGFWGKDSWGVQPEVGWAFDREGRTRQYVSAGISIFRFTPSADPFPRFGPGMRELDFFGVGFFYGLHWNDLTFQVGLPVGRYRGVEATGARVDSFKPALHLQMGYSFYE